VLNYAPNDTWKKGRRRRLAGSILLVVGIVVLSLWDFSAEVIRGIWDGFGIILLVCALGVIYELNVKPLHLQPWAHSDLRAAIGFFQRQLDHLEETMAEEWARADREMEAEQREDDDQ